MGCTLYSVLELGPVISVSKLNLCKRTHMAACPGVNLTSATCVGVT